MALLISVPEVARITSVSPWYLGSFLKKNITIIMGEHCPMNEQDTPHFYL
jgi:hypothetical protein